LTVSRCFCALTFLAAGACTGTGPKPLPEDDLEGKPWEVQRTSLPPYPKDGSLLSVYVSSTRPFAFFIDPGSVSVRQDGIVRYTLVARSPSGAVNVSYEGIRCKTYQTRTYAFGRSDGTWVQARSQQWTSYSQYQTDQHLVLADDFFCTANGVKTAEEVVQAIARGNRSR
jgi:hypothetical protein